MYFVWQVVWHSSLSDSVSSTFNSPEESLKWVLGYGDWTSSMWSLRSLWCSIPLLCIFLVSSSAVLVSAALSIIVSPWTFYQISHKIKIWITTEGIAILTLHNMTYCFEFSTIYTLFSTFSWGCEIKIKETK